MKLKTSLSICLLAVAAVVLPANAKIIRVNNQLPANDRASNIYASLADAVSEAAAGDSLLIEPSPKVYVGDAQNNLNITKRLTIIGTGYFLAQNQATQANVAGAVLQCEVIFATGSSGSAILGIAFDKPFGFSTIIVNESNILIQRCYLPNSLSFENNSQSISGVTIRQNFLGAIIAPFGNVRFSDVRVENNIILNSVDISNPTSASRTFSNFNNNTFISSTSIRLTASTFNNNVLMMSTTSPVIEISTPAPPSNNLANVSNLGTANGNRVYGSGDGRLFVADASVSNVIFNRVNIPDNGFRITAQTAAYNTMGSDGKEPGAFGGANPYVLSGLPQIPAIYELSTTGTGSAANGLPVTIKVKSN